MLNPALCWAWNVWAAAGAGKAFERAEGLLTGSAELAWEAMTRRSRASPRPRASDSCGGIGRAPSPLYGLRRRVP